MPTTNELWDLTMAFWGIVCGVAAVIGIAKG